MSIPDDILRSIDKLAAIHRAVGSLERVREVGVGSVEACLASLRADAQIEHAILDAWALDLLQVRWGIGVGDRVSVATPADHAEGELARAAVSLRVHDYGAFPQLALTIRAATGDKLVFVDAVGSSSDDAKLRCTGRGAEPGQQAA